MRVPYQQKIQFYRMKAMPKFIIPLVLTVLSTSISASISIIPQPSTVNELTGQFIFSNKTTICTKGGAQANQVASAFIGILEKSTGEKFNLCQQSRKSNSITFILDEKLQMPNEGYELNVKSNKVEVISNTAHGLFNGMQSLRQIFPSEIEKRGTNFSVWTLPCVSIVDAPRFSYRGMHLDVSRHFFDKKFILKYIDMMSMYKYNRFHWHLTDDQGWRVEIKRYPKLLKTSAYRTECYGDTTGGFYTQQEIKEVVQYAKDRYIEVIPEIEMPGHAVAVLATYPEFSCSGGPFTVPTTWGIFHDVFCAGNDQVFEFIDNVLDEIIPLFPSKYIHIGGDECPKTRWERCSKCQARIKNENLKDEHELQSYFIKRIEKYLNIKGKQIIGWDEILEGGVSNSATIMSWRGMKGGIEAAQHGNYVVMSPASHCYLDHYQGVDTEEPLAFGKGKPYNIPLQQAYEFDPMPKNLTDEQSKYILGGQANVWSEYLPTTEQVEYMVYPRALALSECFWSNPANKSFDNFEQKVHSHYSRMENYGISFSKSGDKQSTKDLYQTLTKKK